MNIIRDCRIRDATINDCDVIARMINSASDDAVNYLLQGLKVEESPISILAAQLAREVHYSYANTIIGEFEESTPIAMALSFPATGLMFNKDLLQSYSESRQQYLMYFCENSINDSWHLDAIYIEDEFRGRGLGGRLLDKVKQRAQYYKFPVLQVFVFGTNKKAIRFYQSNNFIIDKEIDVASHEFLKDMRPLLRMRCEL